MNITKILDEHALTRGDEPFLFHDDGVWTWEEFRRRVDATAGFLVAAGIGADSVVAQSLNSQLLKILVFFATARLGATTVSISINEPIGSRDQTLQICSAKFLVTDGHVTNLGHGIEIVTISLSNCDPRSSSISHLNEAPKAAAVIVKGSGSTGKPKYLPIGHTQMLARAEGFLKTKSYQSSDRMYCLVYPDS